MIIWYKEGKTVITTVKRETVLGNPEVLTEEQILQGLKKVRIIVKNQCYVIGRAQDQGELTDIIEELTSPRS